MANHLLVEFHIRSLVNSTYKWTLSGSGTNEYYCELTGGGDPSLYQPKGIGLDGTEATLGTLGSLAASGYGYGDNDSLGYSTVYVRLSDGADPDTKSDDFVTYMEFLSMEGIALTHWWDNKVIRFDNINYQVAEEHGGYSRLGFGRIEFAWDLFTNDWPPPVTAKIKIKYTATTEAAAEVLFFGTLYIVSIDRTQITYELFEQPFDVDLLTEAENFDGETVPLPRAFGTVTHANPVRKANISTPCYYLGGIQGSTGTDWHVYDDGVDICANVTLVTGDTFQLTATPVGEVTLTGAGAQSTVADILSWGCGASFLNLTLASANARSPSPVVKHWADSQQKLTDFLSDICAFNTHLFYVSGATCTLVDMLANPSSRTITEFDFFPAKYHYNIPVKKITAGWTIGEAGEWSATSTGEAAAVYVKRTAKEVVKKSSYPYGKEMDITPYHDGRVSIATALNNILTVLHKPKCNLRLPLQGSLPTPGEKISWTDASLHISTDVTINCRSIHYDFNNEEVIIEGEGTIAAT